MTDNDKVVAIRAFNKKFSSINFRVFLVPLILSKSSRDMLYDQQAKRDLYIYNQII